MKNYVDFEIIEKEVLSYYLGAGWRIIRYNEHEGNYEVGLPLEIAYEKSKNLIRKFTTTDLFDELLRRTGQKYGKDLDDYDFVEINLVEGYTQNPHATHYVD